MCYHRDASAAEVDHAVAAVARLADALQVLVLSAESCQRGVDPRQSQSDICAANRRLLEIATEMRTLFLQLRRSAADGQSSIT